MLWCNVLALHKTYRCDDIISSPGALSLSHASLVVNSWLSLDVPAARQAFSLSPFFSFFFFFFGFKHNRTPSGKKSVTRVHAVTASKVASITCRW